MKRFADNITRTALRLTALAGCGLALTITNAHRASAETVILPERSYDAPTMARYHSYQWIAWTGRDGRLNIMRGPKKGAKKVTLDDKAIGSPALAQYKGYLVLAWTGTDHRLNFLWSKGLNLTGKKLVINGKKTLNERSGYGPCLATFNKGLPGLAIGWTDINHRVNVMYTANLDDFFSHRIVGGADNDSPALKTNASPALGELRDRLFVAWTGTTDPAPIYLTSAPSADFKLHFANTLTIIGDEFTRPQFGPALLSDEFAPGHYLGLGWVDTKGHPNVVFSYDGRAFAERKSTINIPATSSLALMWFFNGSYDGAFTIANDFIEID